MAFRPYTFTSYNTPVGEITIKREAENDFHIIHEGNLIGKRKTERGAIEFAQRRFHNKLDALIKKKKQEIKDLENISRLSDFEKPL